MEHYICQALGRRYALLSILLVFLLFLMSSTISANAQGIAVSPSKLSLEIYRGETAQTQFTVINPTDEKIEINIKTEELSDWFEFTPPRNTIEPHDMRTITLRAKPPSDVSNGEYNTFVSVKVINQDPSKGIKFELGSSIKTKIQITGKQVVAASANIGEIRPTEQDSTAVFEINFANQGNVRIDPLVKTTIYKQGQKTDEFEKKFYEILPNSQNKLQINYSTKGQEMGDYKANIEVLLGTNLIAKKTINLSILPYGTLSRAGVFRKLLLMNSPRTGEMAEIRAVFQNKGQINTNAKFTGVVYHNNKPIDKVQSDEMLMPVGQQEELSFHYKITQPGNYKVQGVVVYGGEETDSKTLEFDIQDAADRQGIIGIGIVAAIVIFGLTIFIIFNKLYHYQSSRT